MVCGVGLNLGGLEARRDVKKPCDICPGRVRQQPGGRNVVNDCNLPVTMEDFPNEVTAVRGRLCGLFVHDEICRISIIFECVWLCIQLMSEYGLWTVVNFHVSF